MKLMVGQTVWPLLLLLLSVLVVADEGDCHMCLMDAMKVSEVTAAETV